MCPNAKWFVALAAFGVACGGAPERDDGSFPDTPFATLSSEQSKLVIEVRTAPEQPPPRGIVSVQLVVRSAEGALQNGLQVNAEPWMPAMSHGSAAQMGLAVSEGTYVVNNVRLFMPGQWELGTSFSGSVMDRATFAFDVP